MWEIMEYKLKIEIVPSSRVYLCVIPNFDLIIPLWFNYRCDTIYGIILSGALASDRTLAHHENKSYSSAFDHAKR